MQKDLGKSWRQLVRWLVSDVPPRISVAAESSVNGDPAEVRLTVKARDEAFKPLENSTIQLIVRPVKSIMSNLSQTNFVQLTAEPSVASPGTYEATYVAREGGAYSVEALVDASGRQVGGPRGGGLDV